MSYQSWHQEHGKKHAKILDELTKLSDDEIIEYFSFENMVVSEPDFCPLYKDNKKCHEMENLNCYLCACPNFRVGESSSTCAINSKDGVSIKASNGFVHQDCSKCTVPHKVEYIKKNFSRNWFEIMSKNFL